MKMIKIPKEINLDDYTLILPSVAVGNVGQLCTDLLIYNLKLSKVGSLWKSMMLIPICGTDPYDKNSTSLCTAGDFYLGSKYKIIILQLRSPLVGNSNEFFNEFVQFAQQKKIKKIIILTSSYDYVRKDRSESGLRYLSSDEALLNNEELLKSLAWKSHTKKIPTEPIEECFISGAGFANGFYKHFKHTETPCTVLFCYCSEGDNVSDALILFKGLNQWLNLIQDNITNAIKYPPSWEYLYGNPPSTEMY